MLGCGGHAAVRATDAKGSASPNQHDSSSIGVLVSANVTLQTCTSLPSEASLGSGGLQLVDKAFGPCYLSGIHPDVLHFTSQQHLQVLLDVIGRVDATLACRIDGSQLPVVT